MKTIILETKKELDRLGSALTIEGLLEESIPVFIDWVKGYTPIKKEVAYVIKGKTMNSVYELMGTGAEYPDDLTIVCIKLEDMEAPGNVVIPRFNIGARWFDDVVENNLAKVNKSDDN